jgi:hypothetical protein
MVRALFYLAGALALCGSVLIAPGQSGDDAVRVTVTINPDGSKTVYQTSALEQQAIATTTGSDGKMRGKIVYKLDTDGRYKSGQVFGPNGALRFKTLYRYDMAGRLEQETQLANDGSVRNKIVYSYDDAGRQTGYATYDGAGKFLGRTSKKKLENGNKTAKP